MLVPASAFLDEAVQLSRLLSHESQKNRAFFFRFDERTSVLGTANQVAGEAAKRVPLFRPLAPFYKRLLLYRPMSLKVAEIRPRAVFSRIKSHARSPRK